LLEALGGPSDVQPGEPDPQYPNLYVCGLCLFPPAQRDCEAPGRNQGSMTQARTRLRWRRCTVVLGDPKTNACMSATCAAPILKTLPRRSAIVEDLVAFFEDVGEGANALEAPGGPLDVGAGDGERFPDLRALAEAIARAVERGDAPTLRRILEAIPVRCCPACGVKQRLWSETATGAVIKSYSHGRARRRADAAQGVLRGHPGAALEGP